MLLGDRVLRNPITGIPVCCPPAAIGQVAAPPSSVMNSRLASGACCIAIARVAVGTRITPRPPHRSRRALLTHRAPPSGCGVETVTRQRVQHLDWREETIN